MIKVTRIVKKRSGTAMLHFNTGDRLEAPSRVLNVLDVEEGEKHSLGTLENKIEETCRELLPRLARTHLTQYAKTSSEFLEHFQRKGYPEQLLRSVLKNLRREGFIDDEEVARRHINRRLERKYYGRYKILAELREKGLERPRAEDLLQKHYPAEQEQKQARRYVEQHDELSKQKLSSRLENRGFSTSVIADVLEAQGTNP